MTDTEIKGALVDRTALALTMFGEGRGDWRQGGSSVEERIAVGCVCRNRLKAYIRFRASEPTYRAVCLAPSQFSCWMPSGGPANYGAVMTMAKRIIQGLASGDPVFEESLFLAGGIISGVILDRTNGATSYWAPAAMKPVGRVPEWAQGKPTQAIGDQIFLNV